jgi:transcription-repair coupling factor (superfamily II helicase)
LLLFYRMSPTIEALPLPDLPGPGQRVHLPTLHGSADALALATLAAGGRPLAIVVAQPYDATRLVEEIRWFAPQLRVSLLPDWETLPWDSFSPHQDLVSERLSALYAITQGEADVLLVPAASALTRLPPTSFLAAYTFFLKKGQKLDADRLREQLTLAGYSNVAQVMSPGEYSIRGGLLDLFPMGSAVPYRLDLFDDEIESIKTFDVDTQRSLYPVPEVRLLPAREFPLDDKGRTRFRQRYRELFEGDPGKSPIYKDISNGVPPAGVEYYLPLFFEETCTLFDYLPKEMAVVTHRDVTAAIQTFWKETSSRYEMLRHDPARPILPPAELFLSEEQFFVAAKPFARVVVSDSKETSLAAVTSPLPPLAVDRRAEAPLHHLQNFVQSAAAPRILLVAESPGRRESLAELLASHGLKAAASENFAAFVAGKAPLALAVGPLERGFATAAFALVTENELFAQNVVARKSRREQQKKSTVDGWLRDLTELKIGDPVVHEHHGIGRYRGLVSMDLGQGSNEFLELHYANDAKLFVPVSQLAVISRYTGADPEAAPLHQLGSGQWEKAKRKAAEQARDTAAELLALYATRAARQGHSFEFSEHDYDAFADGFGFEETPDQAAAIAAVLQDMKSGKPMDRLVCGDVGFGKTEVALRAAFAAVAGGKQVAVLCPTTLLCEQHYQNFADRFADWPVKVAELSRFKSGKEASAAIKGLAEGKVDVVIGTHKLIQDDVKFARLGLVIIDEEHRFGVRQKEALKKLRSEVDVLTLTATPIPRTLAMSIEGLRDFSVIATAPQKRLAIKTFVARGSNGTIHEAVLRELKRGGQVYFLHNEVETIENVRERLTALLPEARIVVGHGQMKPHDLEYVMRDFTQQRANLLLCTTIIETGIDNPHANTILINRAEKFGLAQLHQLRGRVGRSHHQAYAYLLVEDEKALTKQAKQRLDAIQAMEELGAGFYLAMHDLEIRGAGEVLGEGQSGEMQEVGFALYSEMLNRAVSALRQGKQPDLGAPLAVTTEINLHSPALLPDDYCADVHERLNLYKRLANCEDEDALRQMQEEFIDRFGELPAQAKCLLETHRLRLACARLGVMKLDARADGILLQFVPNPPIDPMKIIALIQKHRDYKLAGQDKLQLAKLHLPGVAERVQAVKTLFKQLA